MATRLDDETRSMLQDRVMELEGVLHAAVDPRSADLWVVRDPSHEHGPLELAVRNRVASLGFDPSELNVRVTLPSRSEPRRRVRFVGVDRVEEHGRTSVTVRLEWAEEIHEGTASGEKGPAIEFKTAALAAIRALERLTGQDLNVRIIGVKPIHAFDSDLMVASILRSDGVSHRLVGAVVVSNDPLAAAALAVLSALNRTLGNYLHTTD
jgi:hypothetical protein